MTPDDRLHVGTVEVDGVLVHKSVITTEPSVAKVEFEFESVTDMPVRVMVRDERPDGWPADRIGFHPEHDPELWAIEDDEITYVQKLDPKEQHRSLYAVQFEDEAELGDFQVEPTIEVDTFEVPSADADMSIHNTDNASDGNGETELPGTPLYRGAAADESEDEIESSESSSPSVEVEFPEPLDLDPPASTSVVAPDIPDESGESGNNVDESSQSDIDGSEPTHDGGETGDMLSQLQAELEDAPAERRSELASLLRIESSTSLRTRIEHLEQEHAELSAYSGALAEFLDEEGDAQEVLAAVNNQQERLEAQVEEMVDRLDQLGSRVDTIPPELPGTIEALHDEVEHLESNHGERIRDVENTLSEEIEDISDALSREMDQLRQSVDQDIESMDERLIDRVEELEARLVPRIEELEEQYRDAIEDVESDWESTEQQLTDISRDLDELVEWQTNIRETFANLGGGLEE